MKLNVACLILLASSCVCRAGTVHTKDGRDLIGDLRLEISNVVIHPQTGEDTRLKLSDITHIDFSQQPAAPITDAPGLGGLKAEYFPGNSLDPSRRKILRLDPVIDFTWRYKADAPFMQNDRDWIPFCVRWTGQIRPLFSEAYTLRMREPLPDAGEIHAKLWIDNKQVIQDGADSGEVTLQAGHLHDLRIELVATRNDRRNRPSAIALTWESQSQKKQIVPENCLYLPANTKDLPVVVRILTPANNAILPTGDRIAIDARVEPNQQQVVGAELWAGKTVLQRFRTEPYGYLWKDAPAGDYDLRLVVTTKDGSKSSSGPLRVMVTDNDTGNIPSPWARLNIGGGGHEEKVTIADKKITMVRTGGELYALKDKCEFVYQLLIGDGEIVAKLDDVSPDGAAGLMIRKSLAEDSVDCGVLFQPGAGIVALHRTLEAKSSVNSASAASPGYLKLAREGKIVRLYRSDDGAIWQFVDQQEIELPETVLVGTVISCQAAGTATTTFENIAISYNHASQSSAGTPGVLLTDGSRLIGDIIGIDRTTVTLERGSRNNRKRITVNISDIARINIHQPDTPSTDAEDPGWHGVVLTHGDIYEGDLRVLGPHDVQVNSDVLGRRQFNVERDLAAVVFGPAQSSAGVYEVSLVDGSVLHATNVELVNGGFEIDTPFAKTFHVEMKELLQLKVRP